jgi:hypothetical protein
MARGWRSDVNSLAANLTYYFPCVICTTPTCAGHNVQPTTTTLEVLKNQIRELECRVEERDAICKHSLGVIQQLQGQLAAITRARDEMFDIALRERDEYGWGVEGDWERVAELRKVGAK